jgi:tape measure domain-containing protein
MTVDIASLAIRVDSSETQAATQKLNQLQQAGGRAEQSTAGLDTVSRKLTDALKFLAASAVVSEIIKMSDAYDQMTARLKLATNTANQFASAQQALIGVSERQRVSLEATTDLFAKATSATSDMGASQKDILKFTEGVSAALTLNGSSAASAAGALTQLGQALGGSKIQAEEYNAILDGARPLLQAVANNIHAAGGSVSKLTSLVKDGKVESAQFFAAALKGSDELIASAAKIPITFSQALGVAKDRLMVFIGGMNQSTGVVTAMSQSIVLASQSIVYMAKHLDVVVSVVGTLIAARLTSWAVASAQSIYGVVAASRAAAVATLVSARSDVAATATTATLTAARVAELRATVLAAQGTTSLGLATANLALAQARATLATEAHAGALLAQTAAMRAASIGGVALRGVMALLGGPIGLVITLLGAAATAWYMYGKSSKDGSEKALDAVEESTTEMIARLDKQIAKLNERNALLNVKPELKGAEAANVDGLARAYTTLNDARNGTGQYANKSLVERQLAEINLVHQYEQALIKVKTAQGLVAAEAAGTRDIQIKKWFDENGTQAQKMAAELEKLKTQFGEIPPEMEKLVRAKYADKGAAAALKQEQTAYQSLITTIGERIAAGKLEMSGYDKLSESQKLTIKLDEAIATGKNKLSPKHIEEARAMIATVAAQDAIIASQKRAAERYEETIKLQAEYGAALGKSVEEANKEAQANEDLVLTFGMTKVAIEMLTISRMEDRLERVRAIDGAHDEVAALELVIAAKKRSADSMGEVAAMGAGSDVTRAKELLDILVAVDAATKSAADGMAASFGRVGSAIGGLTVALSEYGVQQQAIAAKLAADKADPKNADKIAKIEIAAAQAGAQAKIKSYGDMAGAAKGFFKENTAGYKVLETAEKAFRAYEMAMAIESMVKKIFFKEGEVAANLALNATKVTGEAATTAASTGLAATEASAWGITAVVKALASLPFPANLAAGAATLAAVVAIGAKMMGGIGGGGGADVSKERQAAAGTGSVFGDSTAKSDSIARSIELAAANSSIELTHTAGMLRALLNIESSIGNLGNLLVRSGSVTGAIQADTLGSAARFTEGIGAKLTFTSILDSVSNGWFGKMSGKVSNAVFGGNVKALDTGLSVQKGTLGDILANGVKGSQYTDTKKSGGIFHSDKYRTNVTSIGAEGNDQLTKTIAGMAAGVTEAGKLLGIPASAFTARLDSFVLDLGKISTKDLTGEQIQKQLEAVLSKAADDMAQWTVAGLQQFQQIGEGAFETLTRIATNYANLDSILESVGMKFGAVGMSSIAAREKLIGLAGGIDKLASQTASFADNYLTEAERLAPVQKYVNEQMAAMGLAGITTRDQFRDVVLGIDKTTDAGAKQFVALMALESAFAKVHAATEDLTMSEQAIADQRKDLQSQLDKLTMTSTQLRAKELAAIHPSNQALAKQITARQDIAAAYKTESDALKSTIDRLKTFQSGILSFKDSLVLGSLSTLTPLQKAAEAKRQYEATLAKANTGDVTAQGGVQAAATAFLTASQIINASSDAYVADAAKVQRDLALLAAIAGTQLTDAQKQMSALDKQVSGLITLNETAIGIEEAIRNLGAAGGLPGAATQMPAPVMEWSQMGTSNMAPLAAEIKNLNAKLDARDAEIGLLRKEMNGHIGALITATHAAADRNAEKTNAGTKKAVTERHYEQDLRESSYAR